MLVQNLTLPLYPYFPIGATFPWESALRTEDIATYERNSSKLFHIVMGSESGTRLMGPGLASPTAAKIQDLPLNWLVNRPAVVLSIPKAAGEAIQSQDLARAFQSHPAPQGAAVLIATGWGDNRRWKSLGENYALASPYLTLEAAETLLARMQQVKSNLLLTDCAYLDCLGQAYARSEWMSTPPWLRPPWPSDQAQTYMRHYTAEKVQADWAVTLKLTSQVWVVAGLANCGSLPVGRITLTCLPMFVQDAGEAPCTVMAEF